MRAIVAIPAKDEAERIEACVLALVRQTVLPPSRIVLVVNNTTDATASIARGLAASLIVPIDVVEHVFPPAQASAGAARRMGMERAAALAGEDGAVLTTDADGRVPPDWVAANLRHLRDGADAVAGRAILDPVDEAAIPERLRADDALECAYGAALNEIASLVRPLAWDPWPRHAEHSGASIAVTTAAYRRIGGMPALPRAEDRAFFAALEAAGARVRHAPEIAVMVSGRIVGRAEGGMADTIRRRLARPDPYLDDALEPAQDFLRRMRGDPMGPRRLVPAASVETELAAARRMLASFKIAPADAAE